MFCLFDKVTMQARTPFQFTMTSGEEEMLMSFEDYFGQAILLQLPSLNM